MRLRKRIPDFSNLNTNFGYDLNNLNTAYKYFKKMDLNDYQIASLLANGIAESGFNPKARNPKTSAKGIFQWLDGRYKYSSDELSNDELLKEQLNYVKDTLNNTTDRMSWNHGGSGSGYNKAVDAYKAFSNADNLQDAVHSFTYGYNRPDNVALREKQRLALAQEIYNRFNTENSENQFTIVPEFLDEKYSTKPLFKKGGKAFVDGVNVLDSNPKAYKYVKKKYKMQNKGGLIPKAQKGSILQWINKNSGLIEGGLNLLGNGLQTISNQSKIRKFSDEFDAATKAQVKAAKAKAINAAYQQGLQIAPYLNQYNAGDEVVNNSDIANRAFAWNYANTNADSTAGLEAERALEKQQAIEEMSKSIQGSGANIGSFISGIAGKIGQYIGGNKATAPSVVTPIKDYAKEFKQNTNSSINNSNLKVAMVMKDPTYRLPNYTLPSLDYKFSWQK